MKRSSRLSIFAVSLALVLAACNPAAATPTPIPSTTPSASLFASPTGGLPIPPPSSAPSVASAAPSAPNLGGHWTGTWQDTSPDTSAGGFDLNWTQSGTSLSGSITITGTGCMSAATVTGTLTGSKISFGAVSGRVQITYDGTVSGDLNSMQGTYSAPDCGNATGNWSAMRA